MLKYASGQFTIWSNRSTINVVSYWFIHWIFITLITKIHFSEQRFTQNKIAKKPEMHLIIAEQHLLQALFLSRLSQQSPSSVLQQL